MGHSLLQSFCIRQPWFQLILVVLTNTMTAGSLRAQTIDPIQVSNLSNPISQLPPTPPPQDVIPPAEPTPQFYQDLLRYHHQRSYYLRPQSLQRLNQFQVKFQKKLG